MITLSDLASVFLGSYEKPQDKGPLILLLPSDLDSTGRRITEAPARYVANSLANERARLCAGDVLLPAKGGRYVATLVTGELSGYVASSGFFIIRLNPEIIPAYLVAYFNHPYTQRRLQGITNASTTVPVLNKAALLTTPIDIPALPVQERLAAFYQLSQREQQLTEELLNKKKLFYQQAFQDAILAATGSFLTAS
ncbi:hypothetical protein GCM10027346_37450 [Hymenobacter seoulensis]